MMQRPIDQHTALVLTMVLVAAAEGDMTDLELEVMGRQVRYLPIFHDFDTDQLVAISRNCAQLLRREDGLDVALEMIAEALPSTLRETAYVVACDVACADSRLAKEELKMLEMLRNSLKIDRLMAVAIERVAYARHARG